MALTNQVFDRIEYHYSRYLLGTSIRDLTKEFSESSEDVPNAVDRLYDMGLVEYDDQCDLVPTLRGLDALTKGTLRALLR